MNRKKADAILSQAYGSMRYCGIPRQKTLEVLGLVEIELDLLVSEDWISVEDELPEAGEKCLYYDKYHGFCYGYKYESGANSKIWTDLAEKDIDGCDEWNFNVTHWQPLPAPPEA